MKLSNLQKRLAESSPYLPAEDTFFLADHIENEKGETHHHCLGGLETANR